MHEPQLNAASAKAKPDEVMLRDLLKPSSLILALIASVLFILLGWYFFVLKPALSENNPMDIRLTKKPSFNMPYSKELKTNTEIEPQLTQDDFMPFNAALESEEKPELAQRNHLTRRSNLTDMSPIRSAKSNTAAIGKEPTAQSQNSSGFVTEYREEKKEQNTKAEKNKEEDEVENQDEDTGQKIKSFAVKWKESFLTHATQPICTQVQIAMNQCPN